YSVASEAFGGIKELKVLGREASSIARFAAASSISERSRSRNTAVSTVPRHLIETLAFGGVVIAILVSLAGNQNLSEILPTLSLFTVTGARILPALQETFASVMSMRFNWPALQSVRDSLTETEWNGTAEVWGDLSAGDDSARLPFNDTVRFDRVSFSYLPGSDPVLRD